MSLSHICYRNIAPAVVGAKLVEIYQSIFCVPEYFELYRNCKELHALAILSTGSTPDHVMCYVIQGGELTVLNENFDMDVIYLEYFVRFVFGEYHKIHTIHLNKIRNKIETFPYPRVVWNVMHDVVLELPGTMAEYRSILGKRTKANMSNYSNKLRREFDFSFDVSAGKEIDPSSIHKIIRMNRARMLSKKMVSAIDAAIEDKIVQLSRFYGVVGTVRLNGEIAAGTICYQVGNHCYADIIAHDPAFNKYSVGQVCVYLMIQALIERGLRIFHMAEGRNKYKYRFLGVNQDLTSLSIFRSVFMKSIGAVRHMGKYRSVITAKNILKQNLPGRIQDAFSGKRGR